MKCEICGKVKESRMGVCFDCAEAESIIKDGTDMYDKVIAKTPMEKLLAVRDRLLDARAV